jgi:hypothetical protein
MMFTVHYENALSQLSKDNLDMDPCIMFFVYIVYQLSTNKDIIIIIIYVN